MSVNRKTNCKPKSLRARNRRLAKQQANKLSFDKLEDRRLLASVTVGNATDLVNADINSIFTLIADDGGDGISLREAITATNNTTGENTITFDASLSGQTVILSGTDIDITEAVTIDTTSLGNDVTIDGNQQSHIFDITATTGDFTLAVDAEDTLLTNDQRGSGFDQVQVGNIDIGAFESDLDAVPPPNVVSVVIDEGGVLSRPDRLNTLTVVFDRDVDVSANALTLFNNSPEGIEIDLTGIGFSYEASTNTAIWDFRSIEPLEAGFYTYHLDANLITNQNVPLDGDGDGIAGGNVVDGHYIAIPGDVNLDGRVDVLNDAFTLVSNLITTSGALYADGDLDGDGRVDVLSDAFILVANLNRNANLVSDVIVSNNTDLVNADISSVFALIADDGGDGISLREAIVASNNAIGLGTITFDASIFTGGGNSLIRLTQGELKITDTLNIDASSATDVTITGDANGDDVTIAGTFTTDVAASFGGTGGDADDLLDDNSRVLNFSGETGDLTLTGLTLTGGRTTGDNAFIADLGRAETTHSGGGIHFNSSGDLTLIDSTVSGNSLGGRNSYGGGVSTVFGSVSLLNSTVSENSTSGISGRGGGISTESGNVSLNGSSVVNNGTSGEAASGGGISTFFGNVSLSNSIVNGNSTSGPGGLTSGGGGIHNLRGSVSLTDSAVSGNSTLGNVSSGGGIFAISGNVTLHNSTVIGNSTSGAQSDGGGIYAYGGIYLTDSIVSGNSTSGEESEGGGLFLGGRFLTQFRDVSLTNSTVSGNSSSSGGGISAERAVVSLVNSVVNGNEGGGIHVTTNGVIVGTTPADTGSVSLINSTVSGNEGGGIRTRVASVSLLNSTITENTATGIIFDDLSVVGGAGGIEAISSDVSIINSIVASNFSNISGSSPDLFVGSPDLFVGLRDLIGDLIVEHSLIGDSTNLEITATTGTGNILNQPALLGPLADNGGPTLTHALLPSSPAIDAGDEALAVDEAGVPLVTDQRGDGFDRIFGTSVDIGATELQPIAATAQLVLAGDDDLRDVVFGSEF